MTAQYRGAHRESQDFKATLFVEKELRYCTYVLANVFNYN